MNRLFGLSTRGVLVVVPAVFVAAFFLYPVATILWRGLGGGGGETFLDLAASSASARHRLVHDLAGDREHRAHARRRTSAASVVARLSARRQRLVRALVTVPFVLPTVVVAGAFTELFAVAGLDDGAFRLRHTVWAILIAHVFFNYAVVVRAVGSYWAGLDQRVEEAARVLGAGAWQTFREVTLPRLRPAIASAAAIVFLFSFTSFGVVLILGGPRRATVETEIYRQAVTRVDLETAAALAALQLVAVLALVILSTRLERRRPIVGRGARSSRRPAAPAWRRGNLIVGLVLLGGPIGVLVERSFFTGGSYGLDHYEAWVSGRAASGTGNDGVVELGRRRPCGYCDRCARRASGLLVVVHGRRGVARIFDLGLTLPLGTSAVTIGFGMLIALDEATARPPNELVDHPDRPCPCRRAVRRPHDGARVAVDRSRAPRGGGGAGCVAIRARREIDVPIGMRGLLVGAGLPCGLAW